MKIDGKSVVVSGGASGLGEATVRRLWSMGGRVAVFDLNSDAGEKLISGLGPWALFECVDVTDEQMVRTALARVVEAHGAPQILVNCAGLLTGAKILGRDGPHELGSFRKVLEVNVVGTFNLLRLVAELMSVQAPEAEGERGVIVNTSSVAAFEGQIGQAAYSASKAAIAGMTLPAARELARFGIRVCGIAPGVFDTPMLGGLTPEMRAALASQVPFPNRLGRPEEFALLVSHIVENPLLNGVTIRLDGGLRMGAK